DVRVLAATNRDLERCIQAGAFREDLYYRLHVFPLRLPPLRERGDDVLLLASEIIEKLARRMGKTPAPLSESDRAALRDYHWPGNVRELRNVVERALITAHGARLDIAPLLPLAAQPAAPPASDVPGEILSARRLRQLERNNMVAAL